MRPCVYSQEVQLGAASRVSGKASIGLHKKILGQSKRDKDLVAALKSAEMGVLFSTVKQLHTVNSKLLADFDSRMTAAVDASTSASLVPEVALKSTAADTTLLMFGAGAVTVGDLLDQLSSLTNLYKQFASVYNSTRITMACEPLLSGACLYVPAFCRAACLETMSEPDLKSFLSNLASNPKAEGTTMERLISQPILRVKQYQMLFDVRMCCAFSLHGLRIATSELCVVVVAVVTAAATSNARGPRGCRGH